MKKIFSWLLGDESPQEIKTEQAPQELDGDTQYRTFPVDKGWYTKVFLQFKYGGTWRFIPTCGYINGEYMTPMECPTSINTDHGNFLYEDSDDIDDLKKFSKKYTNINSYFDKQVKNRTKYLQEEEQRKKIQIEYL